MKGIGTDIIEIKRIQKLHHKERFIHKLLSEEELKLYESFSNDKRRNEFLAGRWAVKEALYKALGAYCDGKSYKDFSIVNDESGKPYLLTPLIGGIFISISHCESYAVAFVVCE
ncbi:MAG: holo-ACP synthase [Turicibacter sp.]|nr:holo-ACP synthase [Turicibacter sp.]